MPRRGRGGRHGGGRGYGGAGLAHSSYENECFLCGLDIENWRDATKTGRGKWVHKACAPGADDG